MSAQDSFVRMCSLLVEFKMEDLWFISSTFFFNSINK